MEQLEPQEQVERAYYAASDKVAALVRSMPPEQVVNLLEQYLIGIFDVGILESLSMEQASGVTAWLEDLVVTSQHLDLTRGCARGEAPVWR